MTLKELALEYKQQYEYLCNKVDGLQPLLKIYRGEDLINLRRKIRTYYEMASDCKYTARLLEEYYEEEQNGRA